MKREFAFSIILFVISFVPILLLGMNGYVQAFDNLDSEFIYLHLLKQHGLLFSYSEDSLVYPIFNGLSTRYFHSEFSFIRIIFFALPSFWAYVLNSILVRLIGLAGLHLLLRDYFQTKNWPSYMPVVLSVSFSLLPVYSLYGLSVLGQPLLLWCFLNLRYAKNMNWSFLYIALFPFYSHFAMVGPFLMIALVCLSIWIWYEGQRVGRFYFIGFFLLGLSFIVANCLTISNFLWSNEASHRSEWITQSVGFYSAVKSFLVAIFFGQMHSALLFVLPVYIGVALLLLFEPGRNRHIVILICAVICIALFYASYPFIATSLKKTVPILTTFQFSRFTFLLPFIFYLIAIAAFSEVVRMKSVVSRKIYISLLLLFAIGNIAGNKEVVNNWTGIISTSGDSSVDGAFQTFFAPDFFSEVKNSIPDAVENYRVVCLGFHPSVAQYAGFYTLDSYQNNYPLCYKHEFRRVIEPELQKSELLRNYFDNWGSRCYMLSSEMNLNFDYRDKENLVLKDFDFNVSSLKEMGCRYILSVVEISDFESKGLHLHKELLNSKYPYRILVYSL
jgi:hypothetical protein